MSNIVTLFKNFIIERHCCKVIGKTGQTTKATLAIYGTTLTKRLRQQFGRAIISYIKTVCFELQNYSININFYVAVVFILESGPFDLKEQF